MDHDDLPMPRNSGNSTTNDSTTPATSTETVTISEEKTETSVITSTQIDNENCCIICTDMWTNSDEHHIVALKCGHLFGKKCIEDWLTPSRGYNRCPTCNKPAKRRDIHKIFSRCVKPLDTWERDEANAKVKVWEEKVKTLETELEKSKLKCKQLTEENDKLKYDLMNSVIRNQSKPSTSTINANINSHISNKIGQFRIALARDIDVREGGCRLHSYSKVIEAVVIAVPNPVQGNQLFPSYGVKKFPLANGKTDLMFMHSKPIKDMAINQYDVTIATVSLDRTVKITSLVSKNVISTVNLSGDPWSVHVHPTKPNYLYVGLNLGDVMVYDKRMMSRPGCNVTRLPASMIGGGPVISLNTIEYENGNTQKDIALLSTQLNSCSVYRFANQDDPANSDYKVTKLAFEGRFTSSYYDRTSGRTLLSCRPSTKHQKVTHSVCLIESFYPLSLLTEIHFYSIDT